MIYESFANNIYTNLALEGALVSATNSSTNSSHPSEPVLFLWRNSPTIVIGRFQNPWAECDMAAMERDNVKLARRYSGGGAVYQDLGNACYTLIFPKEQYDQQKCFALVVNALAKLGVGAEVSGRNDILVEGRKVSGSAFRHTKDASCQHGTMLINEDLSGVSKYLTPSRLKLESKGVKSVRSRVENLVTFAPHVTYESFSSAMRESFTEAFPEASRAGELPENEVYRALLQELSSPEWRFGKTPEFTDEAEGRTSSGLFTFRFSVKEGLLEDVKVYSDTLDENLPGKLETLIRGQRFRDLPHLGSDDEKISEILEILK